MPDGRTVYECPGSRRSSYRFLKGTAPEVLVVSSRVRRFVVRHDESLLRNPIHIFDDGGHSTGRGRHDKEEKLARFAVQELERDDPARVRMVPQIIRVTIDQPTGVAAIFARARDRTHNGHDEVAIDVSLDGILPPWFVGSASTIGYRRAEVWHQYISRLNIYLGKSLYGDWSQRRIE